jgi:hypothetical protein
MYKPQLRMPEDARSNHRVTIVVQERYRRHRARGRVLNLEHNESQTFGLKKLDPP